MIASFPVAGYVNEAAAQATGLCKGTPVGGGMFDIDACGLAAGMTDEDAVTMIAGTWSINEYITKTPVSGAGAPMNSLYCIDGFYLAEECSPASAGNLQWWLEQTDAATTYEEANKAVAAARGILRKELARKNVPDPLLRFWSVGHSHLDLAWLWPLRETRRKAGRTFATALANIKDYPDYIYGASQPQQFAWIKEYYPALFEKVKQAVKDGRIEVQGGMWVEADTNVTGGESLVRQFLYGKNSGKRNSART